LNLYYEFLDVANYIENKQMKLEAFDKF